MIISKISLIAVIFIVLTLLAECGMSSYSTYFNEDEDLFVDTGDLNVYFYVEYAVIVNAQSTLEGS